MLPNARKKVEDNLDYLSTNLPHFDRISINIYKPDQDLSKWEDIICKYNMHSVRFSITVPNKKLDESFDLYEYFHGFQPLLLELSNWALKYKITPDNDCSPLPLCCFDDWAIKTIMQRVPNFFARSIGCNNSVLDVNPYLEVISCFGASNLTHVKLTNYHDEDELNNYFHNLKQYKARHFIASHNCQICDKYTIIGTSCTCACYLTQSKEAK